MGSNKATIRELRTNFRSVRRRIEHHGEIVITERGKPAYMLKSLLQSCKKPDLPDYYARLLKRQPQPLSPEETRQFWREVR